MSLIIGLEICVLCFVILRRQLPVETLQMMLAIRARFLVVGWLALYFVAEFAPLNLQLFGLLLLAFGFAFAPVECSRFDTFSDETAPHRLILVRPLASRAPPVFSY